MDRSITQPIGKIKDVLVKVDKFVFLANFIILDCEADKKVPIILGRSFLPIGSTLVDVQKGELTVRINDQQITFDVLNAFKFPGDMEECWFLKVTDEFLNVQELLEHIVKDDDAKEEDDVKEDEEQLALAAVVAAFKEVPKSLKPSTKEPLKLKLKPLPALTMESSNLTKVKSNQI